MRKPQFQGRHVRRLSGAKSQTLKEPSKQPEISRKVHLRISQKILERLQRVNKLTALFKFVKIIALHLEKNIQYANSLS